ncbi:hypothetical protein HH310_28890 [Actinoplanes sp. TBRC 11911]|uniref:hypothetical protein n=1 Tax=Actinoplanes sp. TBRC 11911 TaxID=2729386 RepID=UPI00145EE009|nr:hypothetical protein [Actinoplanes sp. TBRC 11911]NMO55189.1 hypothetical protein [Actinoplanes sp. TBRC 11911]
MNTAPVHLASVLTREEAARWAATVLDPTPEVRDSCWRDGPDLTTIGEPVYRNRDRLGYYEERARATNRLLYGLYRDLYDRVASLFEARYGEQVSFVDRLAVPGFHLMRYAEPGTYEGGGWHLDELAWQVPYFVEHAAEVTGILNFTLPLAVPSGGTGMDLVDDQTGGAVHIAYEPGVVLFNEQEVRHRIGRSTTLAHHECRLTLQGHGVRMRGRVLLFW